MDGTVLFRFYRVKEELLCFEVRIFFGYVFVYIVVFMREEYSFRGWVDEMGLYLLFRVEDKI